MFERLRDGTPNSLVAFHHVAWLSPDERGPRQGEADFILADPRGGLVVLEVKGGGIRYDAERRKWSSVGLADTHDIQDPVEQARNSSFILRDALALVSGRPKETWHVGHAVAFRDTQVRAKAQTIGRGFGLHHRLR